MKYRELLFMGGKSADVRYTSEIGSLLAMPNVLKVPINKLDMTQPINTWINLKAISSDPNKLENDIKKLVLPILNEKTIPQVMGWYNKVKNEYLPVIKKEMGKLPTKYGWAAGSNVSVDGSPVDVEFSESDFGGISVKDKGGITLFSTSPKTFGIDAPKGIDNVKSLAPAEYTSWMSNSMKAVLKQAKQQFDIPICAIGGLTAENSQAVITAGADLCAVVSGILGLESEQIPQRIEAWSALFNYT